MLNFQSKNSNISIVRTSQKMFCSKSFFNWKNWILRFEWRVHVTI